MRTVRYVYNDVTPPERHECSLAEFVFELPYLMMYGVLAPLKVLNAQFAAGGGDSNLVISGRWQPFSIDQTEYDELKTTLLETDLQAISKSHRFPCIRPRLVLDGELDAETDPVAWFQRVIKKYRG